jgi:microcin C transport system substrate-binding protein
MPRDFQHLAYANPDAPKGGNLRRSSLESGPFDHLIPYIDKGTGVADIDGWLYAPLAYRSKDEPYSVYGLVAQKMELDTDRRWLRFYLNPAAAFRRRLADHRSRRALHLRVAHHSRQPQISSAVSRCR